MFETGFFALLKTISPNVYAVYVPEGAAYPCISYQEIGASDGDTTLEGAITPEKRMQIDVEASTHLVARTIAKSIENTLTNFAGPLSDGTVITSSHKTNGGDLFQTNSRLFRVMLEYVISYR